MPRIQVALVLVIASTILGQSQGVRNASASGSDWLQWGGPHRNFMSDSVGLASSWPPAGPKKLWTRMLGEGHSSILAEGGRLYTMYRPLASAPGARRSQEEAIVALDVATGRTLWEHKYPASTTI